MGLDWCWWLVLLLIRTFPCLHFKRELFPFNKVNGLVTKQQRQRQRENIWKGRESQSRVSSEPGLEIINQSWPKPKALSVFACSIFTPHCLGLGPGLLLYWGLKFPHYLCTSTNCGNFQDLFVATAFAPQFPHF